MSKDQQDPERAAEDLVDELVDKASPEDPKVQRLERQFQAKLDRLEESGHGSDRMIEDLRLFWRMLKAPDDAVSWRAKKYIMVALSYFASPVDVIPDVMGKLGYMDDAAVVRVVARRIADDIAAFRAAADRD